MQILNFIQLHVLKTGKLFNSVEQIRGYKFSPDFNNFRQDKLINE